MKLITKCILIGLIISLCSACNTLQKTDDTQRQISSDPMEGFNRGVYSFNNTADKYVLRPVAKAYDYTLPKPVKTGVRNFFSNLGEPLNTLNNLLQGKFDRALTSTYRFTVNSTVGLLGLIDVAKKLDVEPAREDFGQTLAAWGAGPGPYIMLPFLGPTNLRDGVGRITDTAILYPINELTDSSGGRTGLVFLDVVSTRAQLLGTDSLLDSQLDPYAFLKQAFEQNRINALYDGDPPELEEDFDF
ncbi:MAG: VacJ family lipoprotein [Pseudomonadota bacterium]